MAIEVCRVCFTPRLVPGPRNAKYRGWCRADGLIELAAEDMISREEADELNRILTPRSA